MNYLTLLAGAYLMIMSSHLGKIDHDPTLWEWFKGEYAKEYQSESIEKLRKTIFDYNKYQVDDFNLVLSNKLGFSLGLNHLADVSEIELKTFNGFRLPEDREELSLENDEQSQKFLDAILNDTSIEIPDEVDWRKVPGRVSRVKNQGQCGSCWAFASVGVLEGQEKVREAFLTRRGTDSSDPDELIELSEQNLVDCVTADAGCNGGIMKDALDFIKQEGGIDDEESYPYEQRTKKCRFRKDKVAFTDSGSAILPSGDEEALKKVVAAFGPVSVAIDASSVWFQFYKHGVYYNKRCKNKLEQLDHAVLVVGYGTDPKKGDYWIVKNSWGDKYGEKGYIRMARNKKNNCGIATVATIPTFA